MPLPRGLARFNRRVSNRVLGPLADVTRPWAWVEHRGRRSGRIYRTPVWVWRTDGGYLIALTYGPRTEWLKNVLAAGGCTLEQRRKRVAARNPRVVDPAQALPHLPRPLRPILRTLGIRRWLLLDG
ncbi:MAG: nitroreductase family deazaflavin-dependent oxidoreductase [Actinomycetota bacterium]|nr:nitroreductase family deazaflavin-dependent oxidoreductase [Actinomycetota bacterium]